MYINSIKRPKKCSQLLFVHILHLNFSYSSSYFILCDSTTTVVVCIITTLPTWLGYNTYRIFVCDSSSLYC